MLKDSVFRGRIFLSFSSEFAAPLNWNRRSSKLALRFNVFPCSLGSVWKCVISPAASQRKVPIALVFSGVSELGAFRWEDSDMMIDGCMLVFAQVRIFRCDALSLLRM